MTVTHTKEMLVVNARSLNIRAQQIAVLIYFLNTIWDKTTSRGERILCDDIPLNVLELKRLNISLNDIAINERHCLVLSKAWPLLATRGIFRHRSLSFDLPTNRFINAT
tara:strand:- start:34 stop:360 length:327 start_codon:yes stop_codon:yes gene_type:complete